MKNMHERYFELREECWEELEEVVKDGSTISGPFPIVVGKVTIPPKGLRTITTIFVDRYEISIKGIVADPNYCIHPPKESPKDINVITNKIKVIMYTLDGSEQIEEVEPDLNDLQSLCTYLSGGYSLYN